MNQSKLFFITGVSSGFGRALAEEALKAGHRVVGTLRNQQAKDHFEALAPGRCFGRILDVTHFAMVAPLVDAVEQENWGRLTYWSIMPVMATKGLWKNRR